MEHRTSPTVISSGEEPIWAHRIAFKSDSDMLPDTPGGGPPAETPGGGPLMMDGQGESCERRCRSNFR